MMLSAGGSQICDKTRSQLLPSLLRLPPKGTPPPPPPQSDPPAALPLIRGLKPSQMCPQPQGAGGHRTLSWTPTPVHFPPLPTENSIRRKKLGLSNMQVTSGRRRAAGWEDDCTGMARKRHILAGGWKPQGLLTDPRSL